MSGSLLMHRLAMPAMAIIGGIAAIIVVDAAWHQAVDRAMPRVEPAPATRSAPPEQSGPRFDPARIEAMKKQLLAEPKIADVLYSPGRYAVTWQVAMKSDGSSRIGYAQSICIWLREKGLVDDMTDVRIIDLTEISRNEGDFRAASMGHVSCADGSDMGV